MSKTTLRSLLLPVATLLLAAPALHAQRESPFMEEFRKLMQIHATEDMAKLIQKNEQQAVLAVIEICVAISNGSNDQLESEVSALNKAWKKAYDSNFVDLQYTYFALELQGAYKRHRFELIDQYLIKDRELQTASEERDTGRLAALGQEFKAFGDQFTEIGDHYMASQCYRRYAVCYDDGLNGTDKADYRKACEGWKLYVEARDKIELRDKDYQDAKVRFDKLEFDGYGDPTKGPEARAAAKAAGDASYRATPIGATFEVVEDIELLQRPLYTADSNFQIWPNVYLKGIESTGAFPALDDSPSIIRTGANEAVVDLDRDGAGDVELPLTGKITPVRVELGPQKRPWAFLATIGGNQETFQGFRYNMAPDTNQMSLYIAPAGSLVGMIGETPIRVIDDNMDGLYGGAAKDWAYFGLAEGAYQHDVDSIVVGDAKFARPWSRLQKIGDAWYELAPTEEGVDLTAKKADVETGTLKLDFKGPKPTWLIVRGTGNNDDLFYDVVNGGKNEVEVPIGSYELYSGLVSKGKKSQMAKALILPGSGMTSWRVQAGEKVEMELGEPFGMNFSFRQDDDTVTVEGRSIVVTGKAGETYQRLWNCVVQPEVNLRKAGSSRGKKEDKLVPAGSQEEFEAQGYDFNTVWFPISEPIEKPAPGNDFEVQLLDKKNKLFGKIESEWQER